MSLIARVWFGNTAPSRLEEYLEYVKGTGVKALRGTKGNQGVLVLTRPGRDVAEISVISFWKSANDIQAFAGSDINKAVYYTKDSEFLLTMDPELRHFDVSVSEGIIF